ncbi:hypothetical protein LHGZ1_2770 [Laribacter hongkongensis]|uniref:Uncharacterized protein n=1 Tax=Laribacter hongkongensis TaxID=168471 RepID=A0A248LM94_9NEIS|nr:hypothetical protein LHGZ1_2770 [Laribacter hongkongensis]
MAHVGSVSRGKRLAKRVHARFSPSVPNVEKKGRQRPPF